MMTRLPAALAVLLCLAAALRAADAAKPEGGVKTRDRAVLLEARDKALLEVASDPKSLARWKRLAMIQRHLGDEKGTEEALSKAAALDPADPGVNFMRGLLHEKRSQRVQAAAAFRTCSEKAAQGKIKELCLKHLRRMEAP